MELTICRPAVPRPALFLDRDGTIIHDSGYISRPANVSLIPGAARLIRHANRAGIPVLVVTNQSGIDRGLFGWSAFAAVEARIKALLAREGATLDAVAACPFHPDHTVGFGRTHARWRKPGPGLLLALAEALSIALERSWMIGDQPRDIEAAQRAGLAGALLLGATEAPAATTFRAIAVRNHAAARRALMDAGLLPESSD